MGALLAQQPVHRDSRADMLQRAALKAQQDFFAADPALEAELSSAPKAALLQRIEQSRKLAEAYAVAKRQYYEELLNQSSSQLDRLQSRKSLKPVEQKELIESLRFRRNLLKEDDARASDRKEQLRQQLAVIGNSSDPKAQSARAVLSQQLSLIDEQIQLSDELRKMFDSELADLDDSRGLEADREHADQILLEDRKQATEQYRRLYKTAERSAAQWDSYFRELGRYVEGRPLDGKSTSTPKK